MKKPRSIEINQVDMTKILHGAISAIGGKRGTTKLAILSYIKAENPMLSYPNRHNLVFYLRRAINDAIDKNILQEVNGKYKLVSARTNSERSRAADRVSRLRSASLTPVDIDLDVYNKEPEDKRHRRGKKRHGRRKRRSRKSHSRRRRRRSSCEASDAASDLSSGADEPKQVETKSVQSQISIKEQVSSNPESDNPSSMDVSDNSGSVESVQPTLPAP